MNLHGSILHGDYSIKAMVSLNLDNHNAFIKVSNTVILTELKLTRFCVDKKK